MPLIFVTVQGAWKIGLRICSGSVYKIHVRISPILKQLPDEHQTLYLGARRVPYRIKRNGEHERQDAGFCGVWSKQRCFEIQANGTLEVFRRFLDSRLPATYFISFLIPHKHIHDALFVGLNLWWLDGI